MDTLQNIYEFNKLNKEYNSLKNYNIFKKKILSKKIRKLDYSFRQIALETLMESLYNYIYSIKLSTEYCFDNKDNIFFNNGIVVIDAQSINTILNYFIDSKHCRILYNDIDFEVSFNSEIKNKRLNDIWNTVINPAIYDMLIETIKLL